MTPKEDPEAKRIREQERKAAQAERRDANQDLSASMASDLRRIYGGGFFRGMWVEFYVGANKLKFGTPQLFDLGVMLVVIGMSITYLLRLSEAAEAVARIPSAKEGGQS